MAGVGVGVLIVATVKVRVVTRGRVRVERTRTAQEATNVLYKGLSVHVLYRRLMSLGETKAFRQVN